MARYIDADALWKQMFSYYGCINENTAKENYRGVTLMDYEVANLIEDCIDNAPTADVVPKSEVEKLQAEKDALIKNYAECMKDYAREIFEDIRNTCGYSVAEHDGVVLYHTKCYSIMATKLDELEKKYTESEDTQ